MGEGPVYGVVNPLTGLSGHIKANGLERDECLINHGMYTRRG